MALVEKEWTANTWDSVIWINLPLSVESLDFPELSEPMEVTYPFFLKKASSPHLQKVNSELPSLLPLIATSTTTTKDNIIPPRDLPSPLLFTKFSINQN